MRVSLEHQLQLGLDLLTAVLSFTLAAPACFSQLSSCPKEKGSSLLLSWQKKKKKKWVQVGNQRWAVTCLTSPSKSVTVPYLLVLEPVLFSELGVCQRCAKVFVRGGGGGPGGVHTFGHGGRRSSGLQVSRFLQPLSHISWAFLKALGP